MRRLRFAFVTALLASALAQALPAAAGAPPSGAPAGGAPATGDAPRPAANGAERPGPHWMYGIVVTIGHDAIVLRHKDGRLENVDISAAQVGERTGVLYPKRAVVVYGDRDRSGRFHANAVSSWYGLGHGIWPEDR